MQIKVVDGRLSVGSLFGPIVVGYGIGAGVLFLPMFLLVGVIALFAPASTEPTGQTISAPAMFLQMIIMLPIVLAIQGVVIGAFITLGLSIYRNWRQLTVTSVRETPEVQD